MKRNLFHYIFTSQRDWKASKSILTLFLTWFFALGTLIGVHYFFQKEHQVKKSTIKKIEANLNNLTDE